MLHLSGQPSAHPPCLPLHASHWDADSEGKSLFNRSHCFWAVDKSMSSCRLAGNESPREGCSLTDNTNKLPWSPQDSCFLSWPPYQNHNHHKMPRSWAQLGSALYFPADTSMNPASIRSHITGASTSSFCLKIYSEDMPMKQTIWWC